MLVRSKEAEFGKPLLGIVAAFREEVKDYLKGGDFRVVAREGPLRFHQSTLNPDVVVTEGSFGQQGAQEGTRQLVERYGPDFIVSAGFAGGVQAGLRPGDLLLCSRLMWIDGPAALWHSNAASERPVSYPALWDKLIKDEDSNQIYRSCGCLSVPQLIMSSSMKAWIGATFPVSIVDMESYWVSETAAQYGIPHMVVRTVLDPVEQTLPPFVAIATGETGGKRWKQAARYMVAKPGHLPKLIQLATQARVARASLARFLATVSSKKG